VPLTDFGRLAILLLVLLAAATGFVAAMACIAACHF
jgi:hypothetical protein